MQTVTETWLTVADEGHACARCVSLGGDGEVAWRHVGVLMERLEGIFVYVRALLGRVSFESLSVVGASCSNIGDRFHGADDFGRGGTPAVRKRSTTERNAVMRMSRLPLSEPRVEFGSWRNS
jgi:hypothetical protein